MYQQNIQRDRFVIEELWFIPMGEHVPVYNRPYIITSDFEAINQLTERQLNRKEALITSNTLGDLTSRFITPSAIVESSLIDNSWVTQARYIFLLKVSTLDSLGVKTMSYIQGYTNYDGITATGAINPQLELTINSVMETYITDFPTPMGHVREEKLYKIYNVMGHSNSEYYTQRPTDMMDNMSLMPTKELFAGSNIQTDIIPTSNVVNGFNNNLAESRVSNNISTDYLSSILNSALVGHKTKDVLMDFNDTSVSSHSNQYVNEYSVTDNRFLHYLYTNKGHKAISNVFAFSDLLFIDPTIDNRAYVIKLNKDYVDPLMSNTPTVGEYWTGADMVTVKAYSLIESSVAVATKLGFQKLFFNVNNFTITGQLVVTVTQAHSFTNLRDSDLGTLLEYFKQSIVSDVVIPETNGGITPIDLDLYVDLLGTSKINLSIAGFPKTWYTIPTSANSMFSPVMTFDRNSLDAAVENLAHLTDNLLSMESEANRVYLPNNDM